MSREQGTPPWPVQVGRASALLVVLLAGSVLLGYHLGSTSLVHPFRGHAPMAYAVALLHLLVAAALLLLPRRLPAAALSLAAVALALLTLVEWFSGIDLGIDLRLSDFSVVSPGYSDRIPGNSAVGLLLAGLCVLLLSRQRQQLWRLRLLAVLAPAVAAIGAVALFGYLTGTESAYRWANLNTMAPHGALALLLLGIALSAFAWFEARLAGVQPTWLPVIIGLGATLTTLLIWQALDQTERLHRRRTVEAEAESVRNAIEARIEARTLALIRTARRWEHNGRPTYEQFAFDTGLYLAHYPGFQAVEWVTPDLQVHWAVPERGNEMVQGLDLGREPVRRAMLRQARDQRAIRVSRTIPLLQGGLGFLVFVPISPPHGFDGFLVAVFRVDWLLSNVLPPDEVASGYSVSVYDGETRIYERTTRPGEEPNDWAQQVTVDLYGATWTAHVWPTTAHLQATADPLTELILLSGLGLSWLLGLAVYLVQTAQLRAREAEQVSALLREEIAIRRETEGALTRQARELARSNADLEQFAYVASHDLQEPLRMVASYLQLLERRYRPQLDRDAVEFIDYAVDGANRMRALINDLLAYSRVGTRGKPFEPCDMNAVLARALANLEVAIQEHHASVTAGELPTVPGDRTQLTQLFQNLIANAVKFRSEEPPRIEVSAERDESGWRFAVRDNGIGIAPEHASRVFLVFQRLHTRSEYEGTGIGLAICKKIVERHGGRIWVDSIPGKGSVFMFTLPNQAPRYDEQS